MFVIAQVVPKVWVPCERPAGAPARRDHQLTGVAAAGVREAGRPFQPSGTQQHLIFHHEWKRFVIYSIVRKNCADFLKSILKLLNYNRQNIFKMSIYIF